MAANPRADASQSRRAPQNCGTPQHRGALAQLFLDHPQDIGETYAEHAGHALVIGLRMVGAGLACLVHALVPGLFVRTASDTVDSIVARMASRSDSARRPLGAGLGEGTPGR